MQKAEILKRGGTVQNAQTSYSLDDCYIGIAVNRVMLRRQCTQDDI